MKKTVFAISILAAVVAEAEPMINIEKSGNTKFTFTVKVANAEFAKCLTKNLVISGCFDASPNGSIKVTGAPGSAVAEGLGKRVAVADAVTDDKSMRMAARKLANEMCMAWGQQKGFALDKIVFLDHGKQRSVGAALPGDICTCYPDGMDIRRLTNEGKMTIFPRWERSGESLLFISDRTGAPQIWEMDVRTEIPKRRWSFKGTPTGVSVSPDGTKVAAILSFQGNPELYVLEGERYRRLTTTQYDVEGQPTWSPDGKKIAFVRGVNSQQIWVVDVATCKERRLTSRGRQNVDPDWGPDGRIAYITKRGGAQVAVMNPAEGDATAELVTEQANWQHPSWARDMRHLAANRDKALFVIDTLKDGDKPRQMFFASGDWISPSWSR